MKWGILAVLLVMVVLVSGCTQQPGPGEQLQENNNNNQQLTEQGALNSLDSELNQLGDDLNEDDIDQLLGEAGLTE